MFQLSKADYPKILESRAFVRFQDCDPFGHLNNAQYLNYFMNAREDQLLANYDFNIFEWTDREQKAWVSTKSQIAYLRPATVMEKVCIRTRLIKVTDRQLIVEAQMMDDEARRLKSLVWAEFTYMDITSGRGVAHSDDLMALFNLVVFPVDTDSFDARVQAAKNEVRRGERSGQ